jgi:hypothetical protein
MKSLLLLSFLFVPWSPCVSQEPARPLITKDKFVRELSQDYEPPPPGARGIDVSPPPSVTVTLFFKHNSTDEGKQQNRRVVFVRK